MGKILTTEEAAKILGVTPSRVRQFILEGRLRAQKFGRSNAIDEDDLASIESKPRGRPKKETDAKGGTVEQKKKQQQ
jgi:excisionase family DNA binding protein